MALLEIKNVTRRFGSFTAVDKVSLSIEAGEFFCLLGPSGCGKTTLLRMIAGFDQPGSGELWIDGREITGMAPEHRNVHTVFQSYALFPHMSVFDNIAFPLRMAKVALAQIRARVDEALEDVRLTGMSKRYPNELSGGQRQRVAVARALVNRPKILLLDEPLAALDAKLKEQMQLELITLQKEVGVTFIYVTHDQQEALALAHRIAVMNHGRIEQLDEPSKIYGSPRNRFVADFIGTCNLLDAEVTGTHGDQVALNISGLGAVRTQQSEGAVVGSKGVLALRPEKISIGHSVPGDGALNHFRGKVFDFLYLGDVTIYVVEMENGQRVETMLPNSAPGRAKFFEPGDAVEVSWRADAGSFLLE
ncbi:MAG: ABC transporter ATP-binding protein [Betaproteobacteria bacterium]|nr:ABC transporter ATP-binding protein [Betaproteobacteria bacterium]